MSVAQDCLAAPSSFANTFANSVASRILDRCLNGVRCVVTLGIRGYQLAVSPLLGPACRFEPNCSQYAIEAIDRHGLARGSWLAVRRIARCHPFGSHGFDPVP